PVEPEPGWSPVELQIERGLPRPGAGVARGDPAQLAAQTAADGGRRRPKQRLHAVRDRGVRRQPGIEDEGAIVLGAVPVDVGPDDGREWGSRGEAADRAEVERPRDGKRGGPNERVTPLETAPAPLARVRVTAGCRRGEPGRSRAAREGRLVTGARERVPEAERRAPRGRPGNGEGELLRVRLEIGAHEQNAAELGMEAR